MRRVASATGDNGPNPFSVKTQETPFTQRSRLSKVLGEREVLCSRVGWRSSTGVANGALHPKDALLTQRWGSIPTPSVSEPFMLL